MTILSHVVTEIQDQPNGKKKVRITFTDHKDVEYKRVFRNRNAGLNFETYALDQYSHLESIFKDSEEAQAVNSICHGKNSLGIINSFNHSNKEDILIALIKQMMISDDFKTIECMRPAMEYFRANYTTDLQQKEFLNIDDYLLGKINEKYDTFMTASATVRTALNIIEEL